MGLVEVEREITQGMNLDEFVQIHKRLAELRKEEEDKLKALAELQQYYVSANSDLQREQVKQAVAQIRELSRKTREEIRSLNTRLAQHWDLSRAKELYERYLAEVSQSEIASNSAQDS